MCEGDLERHSAGHWGLVSLFECTDGILVTG